MNGKKAKKIRLVAKTIAKTQETSYSEVNKHRKIIQQRLSLSEMKKRSAKNNNGKFDFSGFLEGGNMMDDVLMTTIEVSQRVMDPECFRSKYKALKKNWVQISANIPVLTTL